MLRFDPFRDLDRVTEQLLGTTTGTARTPRFMPMDLVRVKDGYVLTADLPGVDPGSIEVHVDNGVLTVGAERRVVAENGAQWIAGERFSGTYLRQLSVGDTVDVENIAATYDAGVLTVQLPVADRARPRRIEVATTGDGPASVTSSAEPASVTISGEPG